MTDQIDILWACPLCRNLKSHPCCTDTHRYTPHSLPFMNGSCLHVGWVIGPWNKTKADVMICHAKYNRSIYDKHFIQDYKLIVSVRDPVSWMQSAIHYFMYDLRYVKKMVSSMFRHLHNKTLGYDDSNTLSICTGNP